MSARPVLIGRTGPAFRTAPRATTTRGPVIEMTAHEEDGGHF